MRCQDEHWAELVVGRSLDALEPGDDAALQVHLAGCADCVELLAEMQHVAATLAYGVDDIEPPAGLYDRIREALSARTPGGLVAAPVVDLVAARHRRRVARPGRRVITTVAGLSVAAALAVGGAYTVQVRSDRDHAQHSLTAENSVIRELQDGTAYRVALTSGGQAGGFAVVDGRSVSLVTNGLNDNDTDSSIYVLWAADSSADPLVAVTGFDVRANGVSVVQATLPDSVVKPMIFGVTEEKGRALPATPGRAILGVSVGGSTA